jgi:FemAB-related protein (PEP-CTERM system-associated)
MNMATTIGRPILRAADLADAGEVERIAEFVRATAGATPFHLPAWSQAVADGTDQAAHYLLAERGERIDGVLPLTAIRSRLFGNALVSAGFAVGGGILAVDPAAADGLTKLAVDLAGTAACPSIELRGGTLPTGWDRVEGAHAGFTRPLSADDETELKAIPRKQRAEVRRALGNELTVAVGRGEADRRQHYAIYATSVRNLGTPVFPRHLFDAVLDRFGEDADILTVSRDGKALASVLTLYFAGAAMPYWGGGTAEARHWRANDMMYFALMRHARARRCDRFDFGRSKVDSGAYAFKKNWGFTPEPLVYARRLLGDAKPREINPASSRYRLQTALWKRLPLWAANAVGPLIARGLG